MPPVVFSTDSSKGGPQGIYSVHSCVHSCYAGRLPGIQGFLGPVSLEAALLAITQQPRITVSEVEPGPNLKPLAVMLPDGNKDGGWHLSWRGPVVLKPYLLFFTRTIPT